MKTIILWIIHKVMFISTPVTFDSFKKLVYDYLPFFNTMSSLELIKLIYKLILTDTKEVLKTEGVFNVNEGWRANIGPGITLTNKI